MIFKRFEIFQSGIKFLWGFTRNTSMFLVLVVTIIVIASLLEGFSIALLAPLFQSMDSSQTSEDFPNFLKYLYQFFEKFPENVRFVYVSLSLIIAIALKNIFRYLALCLTAFVNTKISAEIRNIMVQKFLNSQMVFFHKYKYADLIDRLNVQITYCGAVVDGIIQLFSTIFVGLILISLLIAVSPFMTGIAFLGFLLIAFLILYLIRTMRSLGIIHAESTGQLSSNAGELLNGLETIRTLNKELHEKGKLAENIDVKRHAEFRSIERSALIEPVAETSTIILVIGVIIIYNTINPENINSPVLITYIAAMVSMLPILKKSVSFIAKIKVRWANMERVKEAIEEINLYQLQNGNIFFPGLHSGITLREMGFHYPNSEEDVFSSCNLFIPKGAKIGIMGPSGIGKSTLIKLLLRLYDCSQGEILLDGTNIKDFEIKSYREKIGIVSQDIFLFHETVRNNIAYSKIDATNDEIEYAAKKAYAHDFIMALDNGYETIVGDRGTKLSGGQRQRLAIARTLLKQPEILIFDEATSALDYKTEKQIQETLDSLGTDSTVIIITHRLESIKNVDKVYELKKDQLLLNSKI
jgi:ATP-binding cassette, subfamily B, bacterial MsbA